MLEEAENGIESDNCFFIYLTTCEPDLSLKSKGVPRHYVGFRVAVRAVASSAHVGTAPALPAIVNKSQQDSAGGTSVSTMH